MPWWWCLWACTRAREAGVDPAPERGPDEAWTLSLRGRPFGVERVWRDGDHERRIRWLVVLADGDPSVLRTEVELDGRAPARAWSTRGPSGTSEARGEAWWPLAAVPAEPGPFPMLEADGTVVRAILAPAEDGLAVLGPHGRTRLRAGEDGRPAEAWWAGVSAARTAGDVPDPEPVDIAALLTLPAPPFPAARRSLVGRYRVGDREVRVDVPTPAELPPGASEVRALARAVDAELSDVASPFGAGPGGAGDCTEHALRFVERARAEGLEARTVAGRLVTTDPPALVLHAWAEVRLGDRWLPADPALGQFPADAGHLPLGSWTDEIAALDGVPVEVLELR